MPISRTPVLSASAGYEEDVPTQVAVLLRWFIMNPGGTSDLWESNLISLRTLVAKHEDDPMTLANEAADQVRRVLEQKFAGYYFNCNFTTSDYNEESKDGRYRLRFSITFNRTNEDSTHAALVAGSILVDPKTYALDINFTNTR